MTTAKSCKNNQPYWQKSLGYPQHFTDSSINVRLLSQSFIDSDATDEQKHLRWLGSKHKKEVVMGYRGLNIQCKTYIICECNQSFEVFFKNYYYYQKKFTEKKSSDECKPPLHQIQWQWINSEWWAFKRLTVRNPSLKTEMDHFFFPSI